MGGGFTGRRGSARGKPGRASGMGTVSIGARSVVPGELYTTSGAGGATGATKDAVLGAGAGAGDRAGEAAGISNPGCSVSGTPAFLSFLALVWAGPRSLLTAAGPAAATTGSAANPLGAGAAGAWALGAGPVGAWTLGAGAAGAWALGAGAVGAWALGTGAAGASGTAASSRVKSRSSSRSDITVGRPAPASGDAGASPMP